MIKQSTIGEHLRTLTDIVERGYGPYREREEVSWPLPHLTEGPIEICAIYRDPSGIGETSDLFEERDLIPEGILQYRIHDNGYRRKEKIPYWPTSIKFSCKMNAFQ